MNEYEILPDISGRVNADNYDIIDIINVINNESVSEEIKTERKFFD